MPDTQDFYPSRSAFATGVRSRCPRCGEGRIFKGFLEVRAACSNCGLDLSEVDTGDGPAVFVIFLVGFVLVGLAAWMELSVRPPIWLHLALWIPLIVILSLGLLRPFKGILIALQYKHKAREGQLDQ